MIQAIFKEKTKTNMIYDVKRDHQNNRANSFNTIGLMYMHGTILNELIKKFQHHEITPHIVYIILI